MCGRRSFAKEGTLSLEVDLRPAASSALYRPLDYVLGTPALVRVLRVLVEHGGSLGVSDIASRARLSLPSTRQALHRLLEMEIVDATGSGRSMVCALVPSHPMADALTTLFEAERQHADALLETIRRAAVRLEPPPLAVWLYGSVARGEDTPASDVDVAIVSALPNPTAQADTLRDRIANELPERDQRVSVIALAPKDVRRLARERAEIWTELVRDAAVLAGYDPAGLLEHLSRRAARA